MRKKCGHSFHQMHFSIFSVLYGEGLSPRNPMLPSPGSLGKSIIPSKTLIYSTNVELFQKYQQQCEEEAGIDSNLFAA
jgi:hypothetical protein